MSTPSLPIDRREYHRRPGVGFGMLGLAGLLEQSRELAAASTVPVGVPHFAPKAKRVIHFFLNGGPSHVDTFDPKPALLKYAGQPLPQSFLAERKPGARFLRRSNSSATDGAGSKSANCSPRRRSTSMTSP